MPDEPDTVERFLPLPAADLRLLMLLCDGPAHAYGISKRVEADEGAVSLGIGSLYRILARMLDDGLIDELPPDPAATGHEAKRKVYRITDLGRSVVSAECRRLRDVVEAAAERDLIGLPRGRTS